MSKDRNVSINLNKIGWSFKEVLKIATHINPNNWSIVESIDKIAFIEIKLPRTGPAVLQKQLILSNCLQVEVFVGSAKLGNEVLAVNNIASIADLRKALEILGSFRTCFGNRNFRRTNKSVSSVTTNYWRHTQCLLVYKAGDTPKERCCDSCLKLNYFLPKGIAIPAVEEDDDDDDGDDEDDNIQPLLKRIKQEYIENEPLLLDEIKKEEN